MSESRTDRLWGEITRAGGIEPYINGQLREKGFLVERRPVENMSKKELDEYKKSLKKEAAERRALKKKAWLSYRETHLVHLGEGIFWNDDLDIDKYDLPEPEKRAADNDLPQLDKPRDLAESLDMSIPELRRMTYHRDAATRLNYRRFTIPKRSGGERPIWAPLPRLMAAQRWILSEILEHIPVHGAAHGFLPGRSILTNAREHVNSRLVLRVDLENFFPTVTFRRAKGVFRKSGYREQIATLLALLCTEAPRKEVKDGDETYFISLGPRCLPQGAPTSPALTNIVCMRLDRRLTGLAKRLGWRYTRYADDMTFSLPADSSGPPNLGKLLGAVNRITADEGFRVRRDKTRVSRKGSVQKVTGLVVNGSESPRIPRKLKRELRAAVHNASRGRPFREGDTLNRMLGYAAYTAMVEPELGARFLASLSKLPSGEGDTPES